MNIHANLAVDMYSAAKPALSVSQADQAQSAETSFAKIADDFAAQLKQTEDTAKAAMTGGADPHALVQALAQTELAVETAVTLRNKVVEAYQEILRMPV